MYLHRNWYIRSATRWATQWAIRWATRSATRSAIRPSTFVLGLLGPRFVHGAQRFHFIFAFSHEGVAEYLVDRSNRNLAIDPRYEALI